MTTMTTTPTIWFARSNPYGNRTMSDSGALVAFRTREERDAWVAADPHDEPHLEAVEDTRAIFALGGAHAAAIIVDGNFVPPEMRQFSDPAFDRLLSGPYAVGRA